MQLIYVAKKITAQQHLTLAKRIRMEMVQEMHLVDDWMEGIEEDWTEIDHHEVT